MEHGPLFIVYTTHDDQSKVTLSELQETYRAHHESWQASETCASLKAAFENIPASALASIRKIIGFGLGSITQGIEYGEHGGEDAVQRSCGQHAAINTMAEILRQKCGRREDDLVCYVQDPAYKAVDRALLSDLGITPLDDPKGFIEVDDNTFVFSVGPNVCVKQIVVDVAEPAAMMWDTVKFEEPEAKHTTQVIDGEEVRVS